MNSSAEDHANLLGLRARLDCVDLTPRKIDLCKPAWKLRARLDCVDAPSGVWKKRKLGIIMHRDVTLYILTVALYILIVWHPWLSHCLGTQGPLFC